MDKKLIIFCSIMAIIIITIICCGISSINNGREEISEINRIKTERIEEEERIRTEPARKAAEAKRIARGEELQRQREILEPARRDAEAWRKMRAKERGREIKRRLQSSTVAEDDSYLHYSVYESFTATELKGSYKKPDGVFLVVKLFIMNQGDKERMIPPLSLVDEQGKEYGSDYTGIDGELDSMKDLNPDVSAVGYVVFDVPDRTRRYRLKVSGGYWSKTYKYLDL